MRVPFSDVDMHGNVHNSRYVVYAENAVNDFLAGRGVVERAHSGIGELRFLVKGLTVDYREPVGFGDNITCTVSDVSVTGARVSFEVFVMRELGEEQLKTLAARITIMWVRVSLEGTVLRIPKDVAESLRSGIKRAI